MSRTIKAIEHHIMSRTRPAVPPVRSQTRRGELGLQPSAPRLIAEWQQRGPETLSGYALHKLRLALAPSQSVITGGRLGGAMRGNHRSSRHAHWQSDKNRVGASEMELMKAVLIHNYGGPEVLRYGDAPRPQLGNGEVLIRVHAAGVNPADWKVREGHLKQLVQYKFPLILGWGLSGVIEEVGPGVSKFKKGDEVFSKPDTSRDGAYAEYVVVRESEVALKPKSLYHVYAAAVPLAGITAWQALFDVAQLKRGQRVLIHGGSGGVGHFAVQFSKGKGAHVIATASTKNQQLCK